MGGRVGSITTEIIADGLVFNMDAANRASYVPNATTTFNTIDLSSSGSLTNGVNFLQPPISSSCWDFDGTDDYIKFPSAANVVPLNDITVSVWQYLVGRDSTAMMASNGSGGNEFLIYNGYSGLIDNKIAAVFDNSALSTWLTSSIVPNLNEWLNITVTRDSNTVSLYLDGQLNVQKTQTTTLNFGSAPLFIGVDVDSGNEGSLGNYFEGNIGCIQMYNRTLSSTEVLHNYNALKLRFE